MIAFFHRVNMPGPVALAFLYGIGVLEVVLGGAFLALLVWHFLPESMKARAGLLSDRTLQSLAFKGSMLVFVMFAAGDILFGERAELWEHSTFLILAILTYNRWRRSEIYFEGEKEERGQLVRLVPVLGRQHRN